MIALATVAGLAPGCSVTDVDSSFDGAHETDEDDGAAELGEASHALSAGGFDFGGVYGYVDGGTLVPNPVTGGASCPAGYTAQTALGTSNVDYPVTFCFRTHEPGSDPALDFGGMWGVVNGSLTENPYTQAPSCPSGFSDLRVLGTSGMDHELHVCMRAHAEGTPGGLAFGGVWGYKDTGQLVPNPATGGASCPAGYFAQKTFGTLGVDHDLDFCYHTPAPYDFGGAFGTVDGQPVVNPATGGASCPAGYVRQQLLGTSGIDSPFSLCWRRRVPGSDPQLDFGGMWGTWGGGTRVNPYTGAASCPAGFTDQMVLGTLNVDHELHVCHRAHVPGSDMPYAFDGAYGFAEGIVGNPATAQASCPSGFVAYTVFGTVNVDYPVTFCCAPQVPLDFGGAFGTVTGQPVVNPATGASSCPAGYINQPVLGMYGVDYPFNICSRPHEPGVDSLYDFGGMWGTWAGGVRVNPFTQAASCPAGFTDQMVLGTLNVDYVLHVCYRPHQDSPLPYAFGGVWGVVGGPIPSTNPATGGASCPTGAMDQTVFGTYGVDNPVHACYLAQGPLDFGGAYGAAGGFPVVNPATGAWSCPAGYTSQPVLGTLNVDYPFNVCTRPRVPGTEPVLDYGGMWGTWNGGIRVNPYTGAASCPAGFTDQTVLGTLNVDYALHVCYRVHQAGVDGYPFGGLWGYVGGGLSPNMATGGASCPDGFQPHLVFGTANLDYPVNICYQGDAHVDPLVYTLAEKLAPNIHLHPEDDYRPASVDWYLPRVQLDHGSDKILGAGGVTALSLMSTFPDGAHTPSAGDWALAAGNGPIHDCTFFHPCTATQEMIDVYAGEPITGGESHSDAYVHIVKTGSNSYRLRYWFFYPYNGGLGVFTYWHSTPLGPNSGLGQHEGDWESIVADVSLNGSFVTVNTVAFYQHGDPVAVPVVGNQGVPVDQIVPIEAYSAWHSHASYPDADTQTRFGGLANDYTSDDGPPWRTGAHLVRIQEGSPEWVDYPGAWGTNKPVHTAISSWTAAPSVRTGGPTGPAFQGSDW